MYIPQQHADLWRARRSGALRFSKRTVAAVAALRVLRPVMALVCAAIVVYPGATSADFPERPITLA